MHPHCLVKDGEGRSLPRPWSSDVSRFALQRIVREEEDKLNALDCERAKAAGLGHLIVKGRNGPELATCTVPEGGSDYQVDLGARAIKHSGLDSKKAVGKRWRAFCSQPQDESATMSAMFTAVEQEADEEGEIDAVPVRLTSAHELLAPLKRGPGRPRRMTAGVA